VEAYRQQAALGTERESSAKATSSIGTTAGSRNENSGGNGSSDRQKGNFGQPRKGECFNCGKPGHHARECWSRYGNRYNGNRAAFNGNGTNGNRDAFNGNRDFSHGSRANANQQLKD
jgi:hypothetical protein